MERGERASSNFVEVLEIPVAARVRHTHGFKVLGDFVCKNIKNFPDGRHSSFFKNEGYFQQFDIHFPRIESEP